jgi:tetratricopeptide (TPR) repeat protein
MKLSLAMIAKNEAAVIGHCLASVQGLADEIILVDTGSDDATVEIAHQFGAEVSLFPWVDDFAAARNESLKRCSGDWVLILDADEAVDALEHASIRDTCLEPSADAFRLILRNYLPSGTQSTLDEPAQLNTSRYTEGREHPYYADHRGLRLCRLSPELRFEGRIHELLDPYFIRKGLEISDLDVVIHHYGKLMEDREVRKGRYYLDLALRDAQRDPANHQYHFNIVQQGLMVRDWPVVLTAAETYIKLQTWVPTIILLGAGIALQNMGRYQESLRYMDCLLKIKPDHAMALTQRGVALALLHREDEARASFWRAIQVQPGFMMPFLNLTELECGLGNVQQARAAINQGLAICPSDSQLLGGLVKMDLRFQDIERAVADSRMALERCPRGGEGLWHRLVALAEQKKGNARQSLAILREGLTVFPDDPELTRLRDNFEKEART